MTATPRVSAAALTPSTRVKVEDLTPTERAMLTEKGQIGPEGFVDIEKPVATEMVDPRAEDRRKAVAALKSVADVPAPVKAAPGPQVTDDSKDKEIAALQEKLRTRSPCPRCGLGIDEEHDIKPTKEDIEAFLKCVLTGAEFVKKYKFFGGALTVALGTRDGTTDELVRRCVTEALRSREIASEAEVFALLRQLTMAASLRSYDSREVNIPYPALPTGSHVEFKAAATERLSKIPAHIQAFIKPQVNDFHRLVDALTAKAQDPSFWEGTPA